MKQIRHIIFTEKTARKYLRIIRVNGEEQIQCLPPSSTDLVSNTRKTPADKWRSCTRKMVYASEKEAEEACRQYHVDCPQDLRPMEPYPCRYCDFWHKGHRKRKAWNKLDDDRLYADYGYELGERVVACMIVENKLSPAGKLKHFINSYNKHMMKLRRDS